MSRGGNQSTAHRKLVHDIREELGALPGIILYENVVERAEAHGHPIVTGLGEGTPDILALVRPGRVVGLECKTGGATLQKNQRAVRKAWWEQVSVPVYVIRSVQDARRALEHARGISA